MTLRRILGVVLGIKAQRLVGNDTSSWKEKLKFQQINVWRITGPMGRKKCQAHRDTFGQRGRVFVVCKHLRGLLHDPTHLCEVCHGGRC